MENYPIILIIKQFKKNDFQKILRNIHNKYIQAYLMLIIITIQQLYLLLKVLPLNLKFQVVHLINVHFHLYMVLIILIFMLI